MLNESAPVLTSREPVVTSHKTPELRVVSAPSPEPTAPLSQRCFDFAPEGAPVPSTLTPVDDGLAVAGFRVAIEGYDLNRSHLSEDSKQELRKEAVWALLGAEHLSPQEFAKCIDELNSLVIDHKSRGALKCSEGSDNRPKGSRPESYVCAASEHERASQLYQSFLRCGVYNTPFDGQQGSNMNLRWSPDLHSVREQIVDRLRRDDILVILPFVAEKRTAHKNVSYAVDVVRDDAVIAVSAMRDFESETNVERVIRGTQADLVRQQEILKCFDWHQIGRAFGIPVDHAHGKSLAPGGGKGLTMLAGLAWAEMENRLNDRMVIFSDTDFINPWEYDSIAHIGIPLTMEDGFDPRLIKTAKTGAGRNNEAWTRSANTLATDYRLPELTRSLALLCQQFVWPLSGNLAMLGEDLYRMPIATGSGIETQINVYYAGRQQQFGRCEVAQVCNPNRLTEDGESRPVRESAMIGRCEMWLRATLEMCGELEKPLHDWGVHEIYAFNKLHGGRHHWGAFQNPFHAPQTPSKITLDYMLPSIELCESIGAINWKEMQKLR